MLAAANIVGNNPTFYRFAGLSFYLAKENDQAIYCFTRAIALSPPTTELYVERANAHKAKFDWERAFHDLKKAHELSPKDPDVITNLAMTYLDIGDNKTALAEIDRSFAIDPNSSDTSLRRGVIFYSVGRYADAEASLSKAESIDPDNEDLLFYKKIFYFLTGNYDNSAKASGTWLNDYSSKSAPSDISYYLIWKYLALRRMGIDDRTNIQKMMNSLPDRTAWPNPVLDFLLNNIDNQQLRNSVGSTNSITSKERLCEIETYIGESNIVDGNNARAIESFKKADSLCLPAWTEYYLSRRELERLGAKNNNGENPGDFR